MPARRLLRRQCGRERVLWSETVIWRNYHAPACLSYMPGKAFVGSSGADDVPAAVQIQHCAARGLAERAPDNRHVCQCVFGIGSHGEEQSSGRLGLSMRAELKPVLPDEVPA